MLFEISFDGAGDIGNAKYQPVEEEHGEAGVVFGKGTAVSALEAEELVEPIEMIEVAGEDAENFELEPAHFQDNADKSDGQNHACE